MSKYYPYIAIFIVGAVIGMWLCRQWHIKDKTADVQRDTIVMYDTIHFTKTEIKTIEVSKKEKPEVVYIKETDTTIIYKDSIRYIALPKQHYYSKTKDAEIWHSGVESSIDSLNVFRQTYSITETKTRKNAVYLGIEAEYIGCTHVPLYLQYERKPKQWYSIYGKVGYDVVHQEWGVGIGAKINLQW